MRLNSIIRFKTSAQPPAFRYSKNCLKYTDVSCNVVLIKSYLNMVLILSMVRLIVLTLVRIK